MALLNSLFSFQVIFLVKFNFWHWLKFDRKFGRVIHPEFEKIFLASYTENLGYLDSSGIIIGSCGKVRYHRHQIFLLVSMEKFSWFKRNISPWMAWMWLSRNHLLILKRYCLQTKSFFLEWSTKICF